MEFDDLLSMLFYSFIGGLFASMFFGNVILAIAAGIGITGIGATELCAFTIFVGLLGYRLMKGRKKKGKGDDDKS